MTSSMNTNPIAGQDPSRLFRCARAVDRKAKKMRTRTARVRANARIAELLSTLIENYECGRDWNVYWQFLANRHVRLLLSVSFERPLKVPCFSLTQTARWKLLKHVGFPRRRGIEGQKSPAGD